MRVALGTLIIKTKLGISDEETIHQVAENPYLQYFLGCPCFIEGHPFSDSFVTHFRKCFSPDIYSRDAYNEKLTLIGSIKR